MKTVMVKILRKGIRKKITRLLIHLANKCGSIHFVDVSDAKFAKNGLTSKFPKVAQIEIGGLDTIALVDSKGNIIDGQKDLTLHAPLNDICTATVTFVIGGIHTDN
jgi:Ran GTPase-activating protein (RanGAP) involved in mRNA processing and transport